MLSAVGSLATSVYMLLDADSVRLLVPAELTNGEQAFVSLNKVGIHFHV